MTKYQTLRIKRKTNHQCTRCGHTLPLEHTLTNCSTCNSLAIKATQNRRKRLKEDTTMMKAYEMIVDDGQNVYKVTRAAKNLKELKSVYGGNGEFVQIKEVTDEVKIDTTMLYESLLKSGFGMLETLLIVDTLKANYSNTIDK